MKPRICMCCGEPMAEEGNKLSRNPNVCASCSSMADGLDEAQPLTEAQTPAASTRAVPGDTEVIRRLQSVLPG